jgi:putative FmdB family regulatory protein
MPIYEYVCPSCRENVEILASIAQKVKGLKPVCPKCGSEKLIQVFRSFAIGSSRGTGGGPMCPPSAGSGCC